MSNCSRQVLYVVRVKLGDVLRAFFFGGEQAVSGRCGGGSSRAEHSVCMAAAMACGWNLMRQESRM